MKFKPWNFFKSEKCFVNVAGAISEIIAYWIGTTGLHPKTLIELEKKESLGLQLNEGEPEDAEEASSVDPNACKIYGKEIFSK